MFHVPAHIENEAAYIRATKAHIRNNARKGRAKRWLATEEGRRANDFIMGEGEFAGEIETHYDACGDRYEVSGRHPLREAASGEFFGKMFDAILEWGALTDGQTKAVLRMIERAEERIERREAAKAEKAAASEWIGEIKQRREFEVKIHHIHHMETQWGYSGIHIMEDAEQNTIIYKGSAAIGKKGETVRIKATIKSHDERDGIKQTVIARPAKI